MVKIKEAKNEKEEETEKKFPKKDEEEDKCKKEAFGGKETPEEETEEANSKSKKTKKKVDMDEDEEVEKSEDEEDDKETTKKGSEGGENPEEDTSASTQAGSSTSPNMGVPSTQNVMHGSSGIAGARMATGNSNSPSSISYAGKSASMDLQKSPLFVELSKQIAELNNSVTAKLSAVEKSVNDRVANLNKSVEKVEAFYKQPFYKAVNENVSAEGVLSKGIQAQIDEGKVRYTN